MWIYGAYLDEKISIGYVATQIMVIDLLFSIFTGLAINALVFSVELEPVLDDELAFRLLPVVFGSFDFGTVFGALFYLLLAIAAITTAVAILEAILNCYQLRFKVTRTKAAIQLGLAIWLLGLATIFSYSLWDDSGFTMTIGLGDEAYRVFNEAGFHDILLYFSSHFLQPLVALFVALFVGWKIPRAVSFEQLNLPNRHWFEAWNFVIRYVTPVLVFVVMLTSLGVVSI
jgi:NSS family neurotransmitter:Na+ symporter